MFLGDSELLLYYYYEIDGNDKIDKDLSWR